MLALDERDCPVCRAERAGQELAEARRALRACAIELEYVYMVATDGHAELCNSSEGRACVRWAERVLGPMKTWPKEPNAQDVEAARSESS